MYRKPLVIAVHDPKWFMKTLEILRSRGVNFSIFDSIDTIPYYSVLYTDYYYYVQLVSVRKDIEVIYDPDRTCVGLERSILSTMFKKEYSKVIVGIDPGKHPYYVILGDDDIVEHGYIYVEDIADFLNERLKCYPTRKKIVRIGGGFNGWKLVLKIKDKVDAIIEVVDESIETVSIEYLFSKTGIRSERNVLKSKDAYGALKIALCEGIEVE